MQNTALLPYMPLKNLIVLVAAQSISLFCIAQSYIGYHSSSYTGVYGVLGNPTDILNHRFRGDINLAGISTEINNNLFKFRYSKRETDSLAFPNPITKNAKVNFNTDVFGPSFMLRLSDKHAVALTSRARVMANVNNIDKDVLNLMLQDNIDLSAYTTNRFSIKNVLISAHAWSELGITYSRQIANTDYGVWKGGISLKYLNGISAALITTNKLGFTYDSIADFTDNIKREALTNVTGSIILSRTKNTDTLSDNIRDYFFKNPGVGMDIGVSYEYRDEMQVYETSYSNKTSNYIWKIGASITDIGFIKYSKEQMIGSFTRFAGNTYFTDDLQVPSDSTTIQQINNYYQKEFKINTEASALTMHLPTMLHLTYDRFINKWLGVQAQVNIPLIFSPVHLHSGTYNPASLNITARAEVPWGGLYIPLSYNSISGFQAGAAIRLGPLVIGSGSLINTRFFKTKSAGIYAILRMPIFGYRAYNAKKFFDQRRPAKKERKISQCPTK